jgi:hypothetical protein
VGLTWQYLVATAENIEKQIFRSNDFGITWTEGGEARAWRAVASSADGQVSEAHSTLLQPVAV